MTHELNVNYYSSVRHQDNAMVKPLASIIEEIRRELHGDIVQRISASEDKEHTRSLKARLPLFRPALLEKIPTGIVSFDIDKKDNVGLESATFKGCLEKVPSCVYAFESPSGGIKFGILTDFNDDGADIKTVAERYRIAYVRTLKYVNDQTGIEFMADSTSQSIYQLCYLSCDPNAYFNPQCQILKINHECVVEPLIQRAVSHDYSDEFVLELLDYIPRDLGYRERLTINYTVLEQLGESGIASLVAHWDKEDKAELEQKIRGQLNNLQFGSIEHLIKVAKENGYRVATGRARKHLTPKAIHYEADPLVSVEEGMTKIKEIVRSYFHEKRNVFLNVSTGAGKSNAVLDILVKEIPRHKKVLVLVPTHTLGKELVQAFKSKRNKHIDAKVTESTTGNASCNSSRNLKSAQFRVRNSQSNMVQIFGQQGEEEKCKMKENRYHKVGRNVPWKQCVCCPNSLSCEYIEQFNERGSNIRIMTHQEWSNMESTWFSGYHSLDNGDIQPRCSGGWRPDYIIIDENIFNVKLEEITTDRGDKFSSIKQIIEDVTRGMPLADAVICNRDELLEDAKLNIRPGYPEANLTSLAYQIAKNEYDRKMREEFSIALERLAMYVTTEEPRYLLGLWVENETLHYAPTTQCADRYLNIPTLFLDATANEDVVRRFVPDIEFHRIAIRSKQEVRLFQLRDTTISRNKLADADNREKMVEWLRKIIADDGYSNVGLITYKTINGVKGDFDEYLANEIGASTYSHFGAIRGVNSFEGTDCLFIVGRHFIGTEPVKEIASAIFGETSDYVVAYVDKPVRMKDGSIMSINCKAAINDKHNAINQHFCISETIQAIGRARSIHGTKKDIYYFSNESLGLDVEVTDFFYLDRSKPSLVPAEAIKAIIKKGYVQDKPSELEKIGISRNNSKNHRDAIISELESHEIRHITFDVIDSKKRPQRVEYFVKRIDLFQPGNRIDGKIIMAISTLQ